MCCVSEAATLYFTTNLFLDFISMHIRTVPLLTLLSVLLADPEISHQWSGNLFLGFHMSALNEATKVGSETTDKYT